MRWVGFLVVLWSTSPVAAYAGAGCLNACTTDPSNGRSCLDNGFGCNPATLRCERCFNDAWCAPSGTCQDGICLNVDCAADGGAADGADANPADAADTGPVDGADTGPIDSGEQDGAPPGDAGPTTDALPTGGRGGRGAVPEKGQFEEPCTCRQVSREVSVGRSGASAWMALVLALGWIARRLTRYRPAAPEY